MFLHNLHINVRYNHRRFYIPKQKKNELTCLMDVEIYEFYLFRCGFYFRCGTAPVCTHHSWALLCLFERLCRCS